MFLASKGDGATGSRNANRGPAIVTSPRYTSYSGTPQWYLVKTIYLAEALLADTA